jgi:AAA domain
MAGTLRRPGFGFTAILRAIQETNETRCKPPLEDDEVRNIVSSVVRNYQPGAPIIPEPHTSSLFPTINAHDMMIPDGPIPWICKDLRIAPGAVTIVGGAGFGGKTITLQALAVAVATGTAFLGKFDTVKGRVLHLDYEQGKRLTKARYRRLSASVGVQLLDCDKDDLRCAVLPAALSSDKAREHLTMLTDGCSLCIVDAFRGAFPAAKENDSEARSWLDMLSRISDDSGCAMVVIMHARKTVTEEGGDRAALRGSSALFDAAQCVWMLNGTKGKPTKVTHEKERNEGVLLDSFGISVRDVAKGGDPRWGLALDFVDGPDLQAAYLATEVGEHEMSVEASLALVATGVERVHAFVVAHGSQVPRALLESAISGPKKLVNAIIGTAVHQGVLLQEGEGNNSYYTVP